MIKDYAVASEAYENEFKHRIEVDQAEMLLAGGLTFKPDDFYIALDSEEKVEAAKEQIRSTLETTIEKMKPFEAVVVRRLAIGLGLAEAGKVELDDEIKKLVSQMDNFRSVLFAFDQHMPLVNAVRMTSVRLSSIFSLLESNDGDEDIVKLLAENNARAMKANQALFNAFDKVDFPFDHADDGISIARYCTDDVTNNHPGVVYQAGENLYLQIPGLRGRLFGVFCQIVEAVEAKLGFEPIASSDQH